MKTSDDWAGMVAVAHTLPHDLALAGDTMVPVDRVARVTIPTLVAHGDLSAEPIREGAERLAAAIPGAASLTCEGQHHAVADSAIAPMMSTFLA